MNVYVLKQYKPIFIFWIPKHENTTSLVISLNIRFLNPLTSHLLIELFHV